MNKKFSKKGDDKLVTRGYLKKQNYVTEKYLKEVLEDYPTKDYLDKKFDEKFAHNFGIMTERLADDLKKITEGLEIKIDSLIRHSKERDCWLSNHEDRILKLEVKTP